MDYYINIYILLYKVKTHHERWIVKNIIRDVNNNEKSIGNYYIVKRIEKESIFNEKFKQFQIYQYEYDDELVYSS